MKLTTQCTALAIALSAAVLAACGGGSSKKNDDTPVVTDPTPTALQLEFLGRYSTGSFGVSAAEIPAYDAASKRAFVVNARSGKLDVLDLSNPAEPKKLAELDADSILAGAEINSVAVRDGLVAVAIQAPVKTDNGYVALYNAADLKLRGKARVGALPDMLTFTPDGKTLLVANEGEPGDDYQIDPEGTVSIIDVGNPDRLTVRTADFTRFNGQEQALRDKGVRIYGPNATAAKDFEPEYIAVSADGKTAWVALQENNAFARLDIDKAEITDILPLGYKDHGVAGNELDVSDGDGKPALMAVDIRTWPGLKGMYQPDAISAYSAADGKTYIVSANEGDSRAWGENNDAYFGTVGASPCNGDTSKGFVEEWRVKHLVHKSGFDRRCGDDLPAHLRALATGALLNPATFGHCGAVAGDPKACRDDDQLGRLTVSWTMGYQTNADGSPKLYKADGTLPAAGETGDRLMYDALYAFGGRSFAIWDENGGLVWDSGAEIEKFIASDDCKAGKNRDIACKTWFNSNHEEGSGFDNRSDNKGPEPEGVTLGRIGDKTFAFIGLERFGGVLVYDITDPKAPKRVDYINTRENWGAKDPSVDLAGAGDLGPEGLAFVPAKDSPNGKPLLIVGNEVSGTTSIYQLKLEFAAAK